MKRQRGLSRQAKKALSCLYKTAPQGRYGYDISKETGLKSGTLYPILMRLADAGYLSSQWSPSDLAGRPPRRLYCLTVEGKALAKSLDEINSTAAMPAYAQGADA